MTHVNEVRFPDGTVVTNVTEHLLKCLAEEASVVYTGSVSGAYFATHYYKVEFDA